MYTDSRLVDGSDEAPHRITVSSQSGLTNLARPSKDVAMAGSKVNSDVM